ncbi:hypothetical protein AAG570_005798 [Ranatra chinensis]|uniref:Uncharacterized protein n=1 Tax=Ranatra chinensis TaxID=642074 RepID=A0ABD0XYU1_9HEMI
MVWGQQISVRDRIEYCFMACTSPDGDVSSSENMEEALLEMEGLVDAASRLCRWDPLVQLNTARRVRLLWASLTLVSYYYVEVYDETVKFKKAVAAYRKCIRLFESKELALKAILKFVSRVSLWEERKISATILTAALEEGVPNELLGSEIMRLVARAYEMDDCPLARDLLRILSSVCLSAGRLNIDCFKKLLKLHHSLAVLGEESSILLKDVSWCVLRLARSTRGDGSKSTVFRKVAGWMGAVAVSRREVADLARVMVEVAGLSHITAFGVILPDEVQYVTLAMLSSGDEAISLLGLHILVEAFDRRGNKAVFSEARLFDRDVAPNVYGLRTTGEGDEYADDNFFKDFNGFMYRAVEMCFRNHIGSIEILLKGYTLVCLILVENESVRVATNAVHIGVTLQEMVLQALADECLELATTTMYHATVASVIEYRSECAPYLLPPLRRDPEVRTVDVQTVQRELYFEPAEVHMALMKSWRSQIYWSPFWSPEYKGPPHEPNLDKSLMDHQEDPTNFDVFAFDPDGQFVAISPIVFGQVFHRKTEKNCVEEDVLPEHRTILIDRAEAAALTETFDRPLDGGGTKRKKNKPPPKVGELDAEVSAT